MNQSYLQIPMLELIDVIAQPEGLMYPEIRRPRHVQFDNQVVQPIPLDSHPFRGPG